MQVILVLLFICLFLGLAPRFMKWLVAADIALCVLGFVGLRIVAMRFGATRGGRNAGMFSDEAASMAMLLLSVPALMALGILLGFLGIVFKPASTTRG